MTYMATPYIRTPALGVMKFTILVDPSYIHSLSDLCLKLVKKIFTGIMHFQYMTQMATPKHKNSCPGGHENYNFYRPFLVIITIYLVCLIYSQEQRRRFFKKYINFKLFTTKFPPLGMGIMKYTISCLLILQMILTNYFLSS